MEETKKREQRIELAVVAVKKEEFTDRETGQKKTMWKATVELPDGDTAKVYAMFDVKRGQWLAFEPSADRDQKLRLKAVRPSNT